MSGSKMSLAFFTSSSQLFPEHEEAVSPLSKTWIVVQILLTVLVLLHYQLSIVIDFFTRAQFYNREFEELEITMFTE